MPSKSVLIIDDDRAVGSVIGQCLATTCAVCAVVISLKDGLDALDKFRPDLVILDLHRPNGDGLAAIPSILSKMPAAIIVLTAHSSINEEAIRAGAAAVLVKPFDSSELLKIVRRVLKLETVHVETAHVETELIGRVEEIERLLKQNLESLTDSLPPRPKPAAESKEV